MSRLLFTAMTLLILLLPGCTLWETQPVKTDAGIAREQTFDLAMEKLRSGKEGEARSLLEQVVADRVNGSVTEEALFRLALLQLRDEAGKGNGQAHLILERLKKDYPQGIWTMQAAPLLAYLEGDKTTSAIQREVKNHRDHQRELKSLREHNNALSRDNRELRLTIERLKSLDMELERPKQR